MSGRKLKKKNKTKPGRMICPNCGEKGPHFVPPSLGEPGFFMCKKPTTRLVYDPTTKTIKSGDKVTCLTIYEDADLN